MSANLSLRQRKELHAVASIGKPKPRADWLDPLWHSDRDHGYQYAASHNTSDAFLSRQIARGLVVKEKT